jgi:hypothetical protein
MQTTIAFSSLVWNAAVMPRRKVVLSGLLAFGAGVAVGANWPRAGNIVGYLLQRLGFELTDLTLWLWDPEKSLIDVPEPPRVARRKVKKKRVQVPELQQVDPLPTKPRRRAKKRKTTRSTRIQSGTGVLGATGETPAAVPERWIFNSLSDRSSKQGRRVSRAKQSSSSPTKADQGAVGGDRRKNNRTAVNGRRKSPTRGGAGKVSSFPPTVSPANAGLN